MAWAAIYAWNPLVIVEIAGSGHVDSLGIFLLVTGLLCLEKMKNRLTGAVFAFSFLAKFAGLLILPLLIARRNWKALAYFIFVTAVGYSLFLINSHLGERLTTVFRGAHTYARDWSFNGSLYPVLIGVVKNPTAAKFVTVVFMATLGMWGALRNWEPAPFLYYLIGLGILLTPTLHPWYVVWIAPFLCLFPHPGWLLFNGTVALAYLVWPTYLKTGMWELSTGVRLAEYLPLYALLFFLRNKK